VAGRPIVVSIIGDNKGLAGAVDSSNSKLGKLGTVGKVAGAAVAGGLLVAGAAALKFGSAAVKSASDAQQSIGATETVFGKYADTVIKRSEQAAKTVGLSANEYRELANVVGASLKGAGVEQGKAADLTDKLNKRAADLAATFGGPTSEAVSAFSSLLRGEADPIERYGISVKQSDVNARLAAQGLDGLSGSALKQAEMQARLDLAFKQSTDSAGAFGRESDTLANRQQVLGAVWENLKAKAGAVLLPALTSLATFAIDTLVPSLEKLGPPIQAFIEGAGAQLGPVIASIGAVIAGLAPVVQVYVQHIQNMAASFMTNVLPALISVGQYLLSTFGPIFGQVAGIVVGQVLPALSTFSSFIAGTVVPIVVKIASTVAGNLKPVFDQVASTLKTQVLPAVEQGAAKFRELQPQLQQVATVALKVAGFLLDIGSTIIGKVLPPVISFAGKLISTLIPAIVGVIGFALDVATAIIGIATAVGKGAEKVGEFIAGVREKVGNAIEFIEGIPDKITGVFSDAGNLLLTVGQNIIGGLMSGIRSMAGQLVSTITTYVIDKIPGPIKKALGIASPSKVFAVIGGQIVQGLIVGLKDGSSGLQNAIGGLGDLIQKAWEKTGHDKPLKAGKLDQLLDGLDKQLDKLRGKAREYAVLADKLDKARQLAAGVKSAALGEASVTTVQAIDVLDAEGNVIGQTQTAQNLVGGLQAKLDALKAFAANVDALRKAGLSQASVDQIIAEGVEKGSLTAAALVAGGPEAINAVNSLQGQITSAAGTLGQVAAVNMYGTGQQAAEGFVKGLEGDLEKLEKAAKRIARALVKAIKRELGIKSPSTVARQLARSFTDGIVLQTYADSRRAQLAGEATASALVQGFGRPQVTADALLAGATRGAGNMTLTLTADELDALQRGRQVQADLDAFHGIGGRVTAL
jgi:hypothetical protein